MFGSMIGIFIALIQPPVLTEPHHALSHMNLPTERALHFPQAQSLKKPVIKPDLSTISAVVKTEQTPLLSKDSVTIIENLPYDEETYSLAFQTFIYNANVTDAYRLTTIALMKRPQDIIWHQRLAQTAIWIGHYNVGLKEWLYVVKHTQNVKTIQVVASIAKTLNYYAVVVEMLKRYLLIHPEDVAANIELAQAENKNNQPQEALLALQKINATHPTRAAYELAATIYQDIGQWDDALQIWQQIDLLFGPDVTSVMAQAVIYDTRGQYQHALSVLKKGIAIASNTDGDFWEALAAIAWLVNDKPLAILGYTKNSQDMSHLMRLIELLMPDDPKRALFYSLQGWRQFHLPLFLSPALYLAQ